MSNFSYSLVKTNLYGGVYAWIIHLFFTLTINNTVYQHLIEFNTVIVGKPSSSILIPKSFSELKDKVKHARFLESFKNSNIESLNYMVSFDDEGLHYRNNSLDTIGVTGEIKCDHNYISITTNWDSNKQIKYLIFETSFQNKKVVSKIKINSKNRFNCIRIVIVLTCKIRKMQRDLDGAINCALMECAR